MTLRPSFITLSLVLGALATLSALAWLLPRERLLPRRAPSEEDELAGYTAALLALAVLSVVVVALNPFSLLFVLPSLHVWLWLPQLRDRRAWARISLLVAGLAGPALLVLSFATRLDLGLDTPWYLATLVSVGYVEPLPVVVALAWTAATAQLAVLAVRRYGPYPAAAQRPPRGPIREVVRHGALAVRARRRRDDGDIRALPG